MSRLSKSEREQIIIKYLKNQQTPGYQVIECKNGKYQVRVKPEPEPSFEVEEESPEPKNITNDDEEEDNNDSTRDEVKPIRSRTSSKQNARKLLAQLSELMNEASDDEVDDNDASGVYYNGPSNPPRPQTWERKRLRLF